MMSDPIDRIVKGAPPPDVSAEQVAANAKVRTPRFAPHANLGANRYEVGIFIFSLALNNCSFTTIFWT